MKTYPTIRMADWIGANVVRVFFSTGRVSEIELPVRSARRAHIVVEGMGLDPGDGMEISATRLYAMKAKVLRRAFH